MWRVSQLTLWHWQIICIASAVAMKNINIDLMQHASNDLLSGLVCLHYKTT